jgi:serine/threonine-protein kinase
VTPERRRQLDALFEAALERPEAERRAWLATACAGDPDAREAVGRLLALAAPAEAALGESVTGYASREVDEVLSRLDAEDLPLGGRIGPYRILEEIGRGGMGAVYLAERADAVFQKRVALKLVKRGMDTDEVLRRFRYERQILAGLEHPNVARLYDGGAADDGRPFLVMEYVDGRPITTACDAGRLGVEERLRLFAAVCEGVRFAHRALVVHRDLKPSNILVGADGVPKLLDFGIAKLLDAGEGGEAAPTRTELRLLTPEYAAPEQRRGEPVTTATDVYALGLVLYELLAGRRPPREKPPLRPSAAVAADADATRVAEARATTPDRLRRRLRGDLDVIVLRALAADPERRYADAGQLLADVRRHLEGRAVLARGDSAGYRAATFLRRNRVLAGAGALVFASLVGGLGAALWQAQRATAERDQALRERARAEEVSAFALGLFEAADPLGAEGGDTLRVRSLVDRGAGRVRTELAGQPRLQARMLAMLGRVYASLGLYEPAQESLREALVLAGTGPESRAERVDAMSARGEIAMRAGEYARADSLHAAIVQLYDRGGWIRDVAYANSVSGRAAALDQLGQTDEARALHLRALRLLDSIGPVPAKDRAGLINNLAVHHAGLGENAQAEPLLRQALAIERTIYPDGHPSLADLLNNLASTVHYQGRRDEAEPLYREAIAIARRSLGPEHSQLSLFLENLGTLLDDGRRHAEAEPFYREALRIRTAAFGPRSARVAMLQRNLALNRHSAGEYAEAEALLRTALATLADEHGAGHVYTALASASLGRTLTASGRPNAALPLLEKSLTALEAALPEGHWRIHAVRGEIGAALAARGEDARAESLLLESHRALVQGKGPDDYATVDLRRHLHRFYASRGRADRAAAFREASR